MLSTKNLPGIGLSLGLAGVSYFLAPYIPFVNNIILAFILGLLTGNFFKFPESVNPGIRFSASKILELSIIFLAFQINLKSIAGLGTVNLIILISMIVFLLSLSIFLSKKLKCPSKIGLLVGFGTAICGSSAIAAVAPTIRADKDDTGIAMAVVNLLGSLGMLALPFLLRYFPFNEMERAVFIGDTLHAVGNVAGAGYAMSDSIGNMAITVKLARIALLSPAIIFFSLLANRGQRIGIKQNLSLPVFVWAFIAITLFVSLIHLPENFLNIMEETGKGLLGIAMAAIGLKVSFRSLIQSGQKAILFGIIIFLLQLLFVGSLLWIF